MIRKPDLSKNQAPTLKYETLFWKNGLEHVIGIDEAGRGALAGPVSAGAVILPHVPGLARRLKGVRDSKMMRPAEREAWAPRIRVAAAACAVGFASAEEIDQIGIVPATRLAAQRAIASLIIDGDALLTDALLFPDLEMPQTALIKGDQLALSVAAASVLAKTARDAWMRAQDEAYPGYGFAQHKGYGTLMHRIAVQRMGLCPIHRRSFTIPPP